MTLIVTVLKSGGDYKPSHVQLLHRQFGGLQSVCLSDIAVPGVNTLPLQHDWPGWFSKMELFNPALINDDILYFDLDTLITGNIEPYLNDTEFRMLSDFYHPHKPASGMMFIPRKARAAIWRAWMDDPERWMATCRGDQDVLENICGRGVARFSDGVKSYKVHVACAGMPDWSRRHSTGNGMVPSGTDVVCFHGKPRPWRVSQDILGTSGLSASQPSGDAV